MKPNSLPQSHIEPTPINPGHPETPPPNIPIPGNPSVVGGYRSYKCPKCGKVYNSKEELDLHLHTDHAT